MSVPLTTYNFGASHLNVDLEFILKLSVTIVSNTSIHVTCLNYMYTVDRKNVAVHLTP